MPIEIREISIKTEINTSNEKPHPEIGKKYLDQLKEQLQDKCEKMIAENTKSSKNVR